MKGSLLTTALLLGTTLGVAVMPAHAGGRGGNHRGGGSRSHRGGYGHSPAGGYRQPLHGGYRRPLHGGYGGFRPGYGHWIPGNYPGVAPWTYGGYDDSGLDLYSPELYLDGQNTDEEFPPRAVESPQVGRLHLGPIATIRRGNEVAAYYRSLGRTASPPYHNGDGYYVDVR